jgi:DNA replication protein DnaC
MQQVSKGEWICCICGNQFEVASDDPQRYSGEACYKCQLCLVQAQQDRKRSIEKKNQDQKMELLSTIPSLFRKTERDKLPFPQSLDAAMRWQFGGKGLLLYGPTGCGKSRMIWEVAKREILAGRKTKYASSFEITRYPSLYMAANDAAGKFAESLVTAELLLLDDVFKAKATERVEELLFSVIDERGIWERPTLVTVNDTGETLAERLSSDRGPALIRRLRDYCELIRVGG